MRDNVTKQKRSRKFNNVKVDYKGMEFDSQSELNFYLYLKQDESIKEIIPHPEYQIIDKFIVTCKRCLGDGTVENTKTKNMNKCKLCRGKGEREKSGAIYTADFLVKYHNGKTEVIDVKGGPVTQVFQLRKKVFESRYGIELKIARIKKQSWIID